MDPIDTPWLVEIKEKASPWRGGNLYLEAEGQADLLLEAIDKDRFEVGVHYVGV